MRLGQQFAEWNCLVFAPPAGGFDAWQTPDGQPTAESSRGRAVQSNLHRGPRPMAPVDSGTTPPIRRPGSACAAAALLVGCGRLDTLWQELPPALRTCGSRSSNWSMKPLLRELE